MNPTEISKTVHVKIRHSGDLDYHEWITLGERVKADRRGHANKWMHVAQWTRWICNNPDCDAYALVHNQAITDLIEAAEAAS